jgi:hypothetical protein
LSFATQPYSKITDGHPRKALWVSARTGSLATVATYTTTRDTTLVAVNVRQPADAMAL